MADFCQKCSIKMFHQDYRELAGLCQVGEVASAICENCGLITVDHNGKRVFWTDQPARPSDAPRDT
jgi:hypothetical protein